jgi:hypothetical protein
MGERRAQAAQTLQHALLKCIANQLSGVLESSQDPREFAIQRITEKPSSQKGITESQLSFLETTGRIIGPLRDNGNLVSRQTFSFEGEKASSFTSPKYRSTQDRIKVASELQRVEEAQRDKSFDTPHRRGSARPPSAGLRKSSTKDLLVGSPLAKCARVQSPSPKLDCSIWPKDMISYKKPESANKTPPGMQRSKTNQQNLVESLATPPRSEPRWQEKLSDTSGLKDYDDDMIVMETEPAPRQLSKSRLYRNVESRTDSGLRSSSVKRLIDTPRMRHSKSPQVRGLNSQNKPELKPCRAVDLLTTETLERRRQFLTLSSLEAFLDQVSEVFKANAAVDSQMAAKARLFLKQLQGAKLDESLSQFSKGVCEEVAKTLGKFSAASHARLQLLYRVTPSAPAKLTSEEKEMQLAEEQLLSAINKLSVRKLKELTSSKLNQAPNIEAGLALLILFSEIDTSVEVTPGFKVLKSRSWQSVSSYFAVPGRAATCARTIGESIRKGLISPSVIKQTMEQSEQLHLTRDDNSAINVVHEYLCSVFKFYDVWLKYSAPSAYKAKHKTTLRSVKSPELQSKSSQGDAVMLGSTKSSKGEDSSYQRGSSKDGVRCEVVCESPLDWVTDQEDFMLSFGERRNSLKNLMTFHPDSLNWVVKETSTQTENQDPNLPFLGKSKSVVSLEKQRLAEEVKAEEAKLKSILENSLRVFLIDKISQVASTWSAFEKDRRRLRLTTEMAAFDQRHAWLEEFMQELDESDKLQGYRHDMTHKLRSWLELASEDYFKAEVKSVYSQLTQDQLLTETNCKLSH